MITPSLLPKSLALVFIIFTIFTVSLTENLQIADALFPVDYDIPIVHPVLVTNLWDGKKNAVQNSYNHEKVEIKSPILTQEIPGSYKYEGLITVTQSELYSDLWVATDGRIFEIWENGSYKLVQADSEIRKDIGNMRDRSHSAFNGWQESQAELASLVFDSSNIQSSVSESFAHDYPDVDARTQFLVENGVIGIIRR